MMSQQLGLALRSANVVQYLLARGHEVRHRGCPFLVLGVAEIIGTMNTSIYQFEHHKAIEA